MTQRRRLSPYQRIVRASRTGRGVKLSPAECRQMSRDTAIEAVAQNDDEDPEYPDDDEVDRVPKPIEADPLCQAPGCYHPRSAHIAPGGSVRWACWRDGCACSNFQGER